MSAISTEIYTQVKQPERTMEPNYLCCIAQVLEEIIQETDSIDSIQTCFHASKIPSITLSNYLSRISKYAKCTDECFVIALIYMDKIQEYNPEILLNSHCIHRFMLIAIIVAIKYHDDDYYRNDYYAKVGGISIKELNSLEKEFLKLLDFKLYISKDLFQTYLMKLTQYQQQ